MEGGPARWRKVSDAVAGFLRADGKLAPIYAVENWKRLVGLVFKNPLRDEDLDFWDDDYEGGSPKKWMRSKYTGPGYVKCYEEGYRNVIQELGNWKVKAKSLEELLHKYESNPFSVNEVLSIYNILELDPSYPRSFDEFDVSGIR